MQYTPGADPNQRRHRSAVSNGRKLFAVAGLDGRTQTARRFRDLYEVISNDLGGKLTEGQRQLARRAATLSLMSEAMEADIIRDMPFDADAYGVLCDRLGRCLSRLGLAPSLLDRGEPRDVHVFRIIGGLPTPPPAGPKAEEPIGAGPSPIKPEPPAQAGWEPPSSGGDSVEATHEPALAAQAAPK